MQPQKPVVNLFVNVISLPMSVAEDALWLLGEVISIPFDALFGNKK